MNNARLTVQSHVELGRICLVFNEIQLHSHWIIVATSNLAIEACNAEDNLRIASEGFGNKDRGVRMG